MPGASPSARKTYKDSDKRVKTCSTSPIGRQSAANGGDAGPGEALQSLVGRASMPPNSPLAARRTSATSPLRVASQATP